MEQPRVLLLETIHDEAYQYLSGQCVIVPGYEEASVSGDFHAIITRGKGKVTADLMDQNKSLRVVARCGVGLDNVDVAAATSRQIPVINAPGINTQTVVEHTISLMLMLVRNMYNSVTAVKQDQWQFRNSLVSDELSGKTLGIAGMGNIGKKVAKVAQALGMNICYYDPWAAVDEFQKVELHELLQTSDVVSIHLPLTGQTRGMIGKTELAKMKPSSFLINTSRGEIIDHQALEQAIRSAHLAGFAADVLPEEPPETGYSLLSHPGVLVTPHSASLTASTYRQMCLITVQNVVSLLSGTPFDPQCIFNRRDILPFQ
ncbi:MAG: hydroxyacid dehydrogenase [Bacteroidia bacterium]